MKTKITFLASALILNIAQAEDFEFFESRIRPILAQECYECHRTTGKRKAGLALDHRGGLLSGGDSGPAIVPSDPAKSLLLQAMRHEHETLKMPKAGAKLDDRILEDFEKWIAMGAPDPRDAPSEDAIEADAQWEAVMERRKRWWSFLPLQMPEIPPSTQDAHPVDRFVTAELEAHGLKRAKPADRATLIRRLSFVLRGLPPTPAEITAFLEDRATDAYEQLVDRYLESEQFGERWARHWMDWVRYADSHGSEGDPMIPYAWRYRDYLIRALNEDVPYDQLVKEHIAGDQLEAPRINRALGLNESAIGPAHLRMVFHGFAPTDALGEQVRFTDDQINVVSKAFMGLTVSCARCHNHKFDAISQTDFYALYGIFASCPPASISADAPPTEKQTQSREALRALKGDLRSALAQHWSGELDQIDGRIASLEAAIKEAKDPNNVLHPLWRSQQGKAIAEMHEIWRMAPTEESPSRSWSFKETAEIQEWTTAGQAVSDARSSGDFAVRTEGDQALRGIYPAGRFSHLISSKDLGILLSPRVLLDDEYDVWMQIAGEGGAVARYAVQNYPRNGTVYPVKNLNDGRWRWERFALDYWQGDHVHFELSTAADQAVLARSNDRSWIGARRVTLVKKGQRPAMQPYEFAGPLLKAMKAHPENLQLAYRDALASSIAAWRNGSADDAEALFLDKALRSGLLTNSLGSLPDAQPLIERYRELEATLPVPTRVPGVLERKDPFDQPLYARGDHKKPEALVPRRFLDAIDPEPYAAPDSGRLALAQDFFRPDNPLSRRVAVNRFWHHTFGEGIVRTPDNLGRLGQKPSHPELLDYLAIQFENEGFSIKRLLRRLVTSETWKASSDPSDKALAEDPDNRLLSHAHVRRLDAESLRDAILAVSGNLELKHEGPSVQGDSTKRSVYLRVKRNDLDPFLGTFDAPVPASTTGRRSVTNVPGQSLTLLNDPFVLQQAKSWAGRLKDGDLDQVVPQMFLKALGRQVSEETKAKAIIYANSGKSSRQESREIKRRIEESLASQDAVIGRIESDAVSRVLDQRGASGSQPSLSLPSPLARWDFETDLRDQVGSLHGKALGSARIEGGDLVLDGAGHVVTARLTKGLKAKTLSARVRLNTFDQAGGGVLSVQDEGGRHFDAIVFAEQERQHWLPGSEGFQRTQRLEGPKEDKADQAFVHIAMVYQKDGTILCYRNGDAYGRPYTSSGPHAFQAGATEVLFGNRHGSPAKGRLLLGRIADAALYDRALTPEEIAAVATDDENYVSGKERLAAMSQEERSRYESAQELRAQLQKELAAHNQLPEPPSGLADLAHAIFNLKEFLYLR